MVESQDAAGSDENTPAIEGCDRSLTEDRFFEHDPSVTFRLEVDENHAGLWSYLRTFRSPVSLRRLERFLGSRVSPGEHRLRVYRCQGKRHLAELVRNVTVEEDAGESVAPDAPVPPVPGASVGADHLSELGAVRAELRILRAELQALQSIRSSPGGGGGSQFFERAIVPLLAPLLPLIADKLLNRPDPMTQYGPMIEKLMGFARDAGEAQGALSVVEEMGESAQQQGLASMVGSLIDRMNPAGAAAAKPKPKNGQTGAAAFVEGSTAPAPDEGVA